MIQIVVCRLPVSQLPPARQEETLFTVRPGVAAESGCALPVITFASALTGAPARSVMCSLCSSMLLGDSTRQHLGLEFAPVGSACCGGGSGESGEQEGEVCSGEAVTEGAFVRAQAGEAGAAVPQSPL